ncbi:MAG: SLBB domain-containing protein [Candidatus Sumerlaeia bacterium]|nr:SLBB domain-containing protein [Candidatus Sumerlaeia bacterium]
MPDDIRDWGVVGAGGAGFPTDIKYRRAVDTFIVNAAECEPLLHKDKELLLHFSDDFFAGLALAMERSGAREAIIGIKGKYRHVIEVLAPRLPKWARIHPLGDYYPAGDEFVLVYDVTGRVIPPGGLPLDVDAVVNNVETLVNLGRRRPVTQKYLTVAGAVRSPATVCVPVGTSMRTAIDMAGGPAAEPYGILVGGAMMGKLAQSPDDPITKTVGGLIVLPEDHALLRWYRRDWKAINRLGKSACDQCVFCTERCPRYLLGHPIEPHKAMRALMFAPEKDMLIVGAPYCCECNLCSLFSCPENLDPKNVCVFDKQVVREAGLKWTGKPRGVHPLMNARRPPVAKLIAKLGLRHFHNTGPYVDIAVRVERVILPLKQHVGAPSVPTVKVGERVKEGDLVAAVAQNAIGANIHASIDGVVTKVNGEVVIERKG